MTEEQFNRASTIKNNLQLFEDRKSKLKKIYSQVKDGQHVPEDVLEILNEYMELLQITKNKQEEEFKEL